MTGLMMDLELAVSSLQRHAVLSYGDTENVNLKMINYSN